MFLTVFKKLSRKMFNFCEIWFINYLIDCPPCLLILFIHIFNIYNHCNKVIRCPVGINIIYITRNWLFKKNNCFCIKIFSIINGFLINLFSINRFLNFFIVPICWFCTLLKITKFLLHSNYQNSIF